MDILSERGQKTLADEQHVAQWLRTRGLEYQQTPKGRPALVDALITRNGKIMAVAETKCRYNLTSESFFKNFKGEWLITAEKLVKAREICMGLCVEFVGILYFPDSREITYAPIFDHNGETSLAIRYEETITQATCNGGVAKRLNAYIAINQPFYEVSI